MISANSLYFVSEHTSETSSQTLVFHPNDEQALSDAHWTTLPVITPAALTQRLDHVTTRARDQAGTAADTAETAGLRVLWRAGDRWRDLADVVAEPVTIVTEHHTARLIHQHEHWQSRVPASGGHVMFRDNYPAPLSRVTTATPCGLTTVGESPLGWQASSRLILVLEGLHDAWRSTILTAGHPIPSINDWTTDGHPDAVCGAVYCINKDHEPDFRSMPPA